MKKRAEGMKRAFEIGSAQRPLSRGLEPERGTTPVPTALIDRVMPVLRDTELRVLLVVVRQTLGWQVGKDPYLRKERDWLTQSQLMRRTGRASGAVAHAVDALVRRGLIDVLSEDERPLLTPSERRRCLGRLYYRLHRQEEPAPKSERADKSEHAKPHTTKDKLYKNRPNRMSAGDKSVDNPVSRTRDSVVRGDSVVRKDGWVRAGKIVAEKPGLCRTKEPTKASS